MQKTQSPLLRLWQLGREHHGGLIAAIFCAVAGVLLGLLPYLSAGHILVALLTGQQDWNFYLLWCMVALGGYLAKTLLYNLALSLSHKATFQILRDIRKMVLSKMPRLPLGDILDTSSGRLKHCLLYTSPDRCGQGSGGTNLRKAPLLYRNADKCWGRSHYCRAGRLPDRACHQRE